MFETILSNIHLEKIFWIIKKRIAIVIIFAVMGAVAGGLFAMNISSVTYRAVVSFYVYSNPEYLYDSSVNITSSELSMAKNLVQSYTRVLKSNTVLEKVIEATGLVYTPEQLSGMISSAAVDNTAIFYVYVYNSNPYYAMELANGIAEVAPTEIARIVKSGGVEILDYAQLPTTPYSSTNVLLFVLLGFIGAGALSACCFLIVGLMDSTIRRKYELKLNFNIPILGEIPLMLARKRKEKVNILLGVDSPFAVKESYNRLRTNLLFTRRGEKCPVYVITSAEQNEGKSLNAVNIAISMSQIEKKILLIDGDMRNASVARTLGVKEKTGLSHYLAGIEEKPELIKVSEYLDVFCVGTIPPNPAELLGSKKMTAFLKEMQEEYDCILIDQPPIGIVSDALMLAGLATGYLLVVRAGVTKMVRLKGVVQLLEQMDANISGIIFNGMDPKSQDYTYRKYGYEYRYGQSKEE